jgi:hypothetical protein
MDQVTLLMQDRILKSQKKLDKENDFTFGLLDSLFAMVESYLDFDHGDNQSRSDSCNLELGD